jgi:polysaccharide export outer membrane protein
MQTDTRVRDHGGTLSVVMNVMNSPMLRSLVLLLALFLAGAPPSYAQQEYLLGTGDILKITVFKNPDLSMEARVSELGSISFPLVGAVQVRGLTLPGAERKISQMLKDGNFVLNPQVNALLLQAVSNQVAVLGQVKAPGRYSIETSGGNLSGVLAAAGGIAQTGADTVIVTGTREGKSFRREIDIVAMFGAGAMAEDIPLVGGDALFVNRASQFYVYGEVQRPGVFRLERDMTVMQALAAGGGITPNGTTRGVVLHRRDGAGKVKEMNVGLQDSVKDEDVIYVKAGLF